jgi:HEAT repeat protein
VPQLIGALNDEFLYVRICAAGALGSIGPKAQQAREALRAFANDPTMRHEAEWALNRIGYLTSCARGFRRAPTSNNGGSNRQSSR